MRDQGLTRPRVLIVVPFRDAALRIINTFIKLLETEGTTQHVSHRKRFQDEFSEQQEYQSNVTRPGKFKYLIIYVLTDIVFIRRARAIARTCMLPLTLFGPSDLPLALHTPRVW